MITLKQFINLSRMIQFAFAKDENLVLNHGRVEAADATIQELYKGLRALTPLIICKDGQRISVQTHCYSHCEFSGVDDEGWYYPSTCNLEPTVAETDCTDLDQYGANTISDIEAWIDSHGGIDLDATIEYMYNNIKK